MARPAALIVALLGLAATTALAQDTAIPSEEATAEAPPELKALAESCSAHKFETAVIAEGRRRPINVKLCGKEGQSDAEWLVTLKDSVVKTAANEDLAQPVRDQIVAALQAEIARLEIAQAVSAPAAKLTGMPEEAVAPAEAPPQYSTLPPLPAPKPRNAAATPAPPVKKPRLTILCSMPGQGGGSEPCASLKRETRLTVRADEDLTGTTSLRFLRGGDARAELDLGPLRSGQSLRSKLPGRVCSGVLRGKVQMQILSAGQVVETRGPYALYCGS